MKPKFIVRLLTIVIITHIKQLHLVLLLFGVGLRLRILIVMHISSNKCQATLGHASVATRRRNWGREIEGGRWGGDGSDEKGLQQALR